MTFSKEKISFFKTLKRNNKKEWFEKNRSKYEAVVKSPNLAFLLKIRPLLLKEFPFLKVDRYSIMRINRDIRFSPNKDPYKTFSGFSFNETRFGKEYAPGFYLGYDPTGIALGFGSYIFADKTFRAHFREQITSNETRAAEFTRIVKALRKAGYEPHGKELKKIPPGFDPDHPNAEFLMYNGLYFSKEFDMPKEFYTEKFPEFCMKIIRPLKEFYQWMAETYRSAPNRTDFF